MPRVLDHSALLGLAALLVWLPACGPSGQPSDVPAATEAMTPPETVDPMIGTGGHGHTFPGATAPFGMVQLSPDTRLTGWDGCSGYHVDDDLIYGFSHTHLSGTGVSDYGDVLLMPTTSNAALTDATHERFPFADHFNHSNEDSAAGRYSVMLDAGIEVELTAGPRVGLHRYRFPSSAPRQAVFVDLEHRDEVLESSFEVTGPNEIAGHRRSAAWARDQHVYFVARFSRPVTSHSVTEASKPSEASGLHTGKALRAILEFEPRDEPLVVAVGISAVGIDGARANLEAEAADLDFDRVLRATTEDWNTQLGRIEIEGGTAEQREVFYTALYHSYVAPNLYMDVDGRYRGRDLAVHQADGFTNYTVFSLWDTFRATHPLFTITQRERTVDFIQTFLAQYQQGGALPVWELSANETGTMIGYHAVPVIADAYFKGIRDFDTELALEAMVHSADLDHLGLEGYKREGFVDADLEHESVSKTLEYAYDDWCIAKMADDMGKQDIAERFYARAQSYRNVFDGSTGFMRARQNGGWVAPFEPGEANVHYTEATAWQYAFFVPQDIPGHVDLLGGPQPYIAHLDEAFESSAELSGSVQADITGLIGQYAHGNEPSHHMAYLYAEAGAPWKTQARVRQILDEQYNGTPAGLSGNEDCGQMSSWYVLSALGFYSVTPGSDRYVIGTPLFPRASVHLENGNTFVVEASAMSESNIYVQSATLDGTPLEAAELRHEQIMAGGTLRFEMGPEPNRSWGASPSPRDPELAARPIVEVPAIDAGAMSFESKATVRIAHPNDAAQIHYTIDGSAPGPDTPKYGNPFDLTGTTTIRAVAIAEGKRSGEARAKIHRRPSGRSVSITHPYRPQYSAGGDIGLIDGIRGAENWRTGRWQGYQGTDFEAIIDLGAVRKLRRIAGGFLQDQKSWIWMPAEVEYAVSTNGEDFDVIANLKSDVGDREDGVLVREAEVELKGRKARYVRVRAKGRGPIPDWHPGAGNERFIFVDEITIE